MRCAYEAAMAGVPLDVRAKDNPALAKALAGAFA